MRWHEFQCNILLKVHYNVEHPVVWVTSRLQVRWTGISLYVTCRSIPRFRTPGILGFLAFQGKMEEDLIYIWMITENVSEMDPISIIVLRHLFFYHSGILSLKGGWCR